MKELKTSDELINHLKKKGCKFTITDEETATQFISDNSYYMKLASFRKNYDKIEYGINKVKYKNLEFAYLQELSTIDMRLRYLIIQMCADIEHSIRTRLVHDIEENDEDDGYKCVGKFIGNNVSILKSFKHIIDEKKGGYSTKLIEKYYPYFPVWVFVEFITFGTLAGLCNFYNEMYQRDVLSIDTRLLNSVRDLRNASAHNNCIINDLKKGTNIPLPEITSFASQAGISKKTRDKKLSNKFINDFTSLVYVYQHIVDSRGIQKHRMKELKDFVEQRLFEHKDYFQRNDLITSSFQFMKKLLVMCNHQKSNYCTE